MRLFCDNFLEILSRLPAKAIYKFMSTCNSFSKFSKEAYFALKQDQHALLRDDTCFFIQPEIPVSATQWNNLPVEFHPLPGEESSSGVSKSALAYFFKGVKILCSSNGLVLCSVANENEVKLFITNPATQSSFHIPTLEQLQSSNNVYDLKMGFACDCDGNFMMYHFVDNMVEWSSYFGCKVYNFKEGVWQEKERFFSSSGNLRFELPVHYRGAVHFVSDCSSYITRHNPYFRPYIMSYNFQDGKFTMLRVPRDARKGSHDKSCEMRIFKWGKIADSYQSICLVRLRKGVFTAWVLTEYESSLWRKILKIRVRAMRGLENDPSQIGVKDFVVLNGELLVFATKNKVHVYGLRDRKIHKSWNLECDFNALRFTSYTCTLRTCDIWS